MEWMGDDSPISSGKYDQADYDRMRSSLMEAQRVHRGVYNDMFAGISIDSMTFQSHDRAAIDTLQRWRRDSQNFREINEECMRRAEKIKSMNEEIHRLHTELLALRVQNNNMAESMANMIAMYPSMSVPPEMISDGLKWLNEKK